MVMAVIPLMFVDLSRRNLCLPVMMGSTVMSLESGYGNVPNDDEVNQMVCEEVDVVLTESATVTMVKALTSETGVPDMDLHRLNGMELRSASRTG